MGCKQFYDLFYYINSSASTYFPINGGIIGRAIGWTSYVCKPSKFLSFYVQTSFERSVGCRYPKYLDCLLKKHCAIADITYWWGVVWYWRRGIWWIPFAKIHLIVKIFIELGEFYLLERKTKSHWLNSINCLK